MTISMNTNMTMNTHRDQDQDKASSEALTAASRSNSNNNSNTKYNDAQRGLEFDSSTIVPLELELENAEDPDKDAGRTYVYTDSARRAWCAVFGGWAIQFAAIGVLTSFGVFQAYYETVFLPSYTSSDITWIGSLQLLLELALGPIGGKALDKGQYRTVLSVGCAIFLFSLFMLSLAKPDQYYQVFLSQGLGIGIGLGLVYTPTLAAVSAHFKKGRALALGIMATSTAIGGAAFTIMLNYLIQGSVGFAWGVRIAGFVSLFCMTIGVAFSSLPRRPIHTHTPSSPPPSSSTPPSSNPPKPPSAPPAKIFDPSFTLVLLSGFIASLGTWFPLYYIQLFAQLHGVSPTLAFYSIAITNFMGIFGRTIPNWLGDRYGVVNVYLPGTVLAGLVGFAMFGAGTAVGMVLFSIFYGFFFGLTIATYVPLIAAISPHGVDIGKRIGISLVPVGIASFVGPPITGALLGPNDDWWKCITFSSVTILAGATFLIPVQIIQSRIKRGKVSRGGA